MSKEIEKQLSAINSGRMGELVWNHLEPIFTHLRTQHLSEMKSDFRAGKFDAVRVQSKIAALCDLDDIEAKLTRQVAKGQRATATNHGKGLNNVETESI